MKKYEFLDWATADIVFKAYGKDLNELFSNSALALFEVMTDVSKVEPKEKRTLAVEGEDLKSLMFEWVNGLLFLVDTEGMLFSKFEVEASGNKINATVYGEKIDKNKHELKGEVKSCTYHKMEIKENDVWEAQVLLDV